MSKSVIAVGNRSTGDWVDIWHDKSTNEQTLVIKHGDDMTELLHLSVSGTKDRKIVVDLLPGGAERMIVREADPDSNRMQVRKFEKRDEDRGLHSFVDTEDGSALRFYLPNGNYVELPKAAEPGVYTPSAANEIMGQPKMMFDVAFAFAHNEHVTLSGPTGIGKTTIFRWLAWKLNWNLVIMPITRGTQDRHMVGEYAPAGPGDFRWTYGPVARAVQLSQDHPTILLLDEMNRIGNVQEYARIYSLLDDTRMLELPEKRQEDGNVEELVAGQLYIAGTSNPVDDDGGDYIGVRELDPALASRFKFQPKLGYPDVETEARALQKRVPNVDRGVLIRMCKIAKDIRDAAHIRFPISFRELEAWAIGMSYYGFRDAAETAFIEKAPSAFRSDIRDMLKLEGS